VAIATNECNTAVSNGAVASSCNNDSSSNVPSGVCFRNSSLEPAVEADSHEWTSGSSQSAGVDQMICTNDSSHKCAVSSDDTLPLNDASQ